MDADQKETLVSKQHKPEEEVKVGGKIRVWPLFIRIFHILLIAGFLTNYFFHKPFKLHLIIGLTIIGLLVLRILVGFFGTKRVRFCDFIYPVPEIFSYLKALFKGNARRYLGHSPAGGAMVIALLTAFVFLTGTGLSSYLRFRWLMSESLSPKTDSLLHTLVNSHGFLANLVMVLVVFHIFGVIAASLSHKEDLVMPMITGWKKKGDSDH